MRLALATVGVGVLLVILGATRDWATVTAKAAIDGLGSGQIAQVGVAGDQLGPFSALAWFTVLVALGVLVTAGRGRWPVGAGLLGLAGALGWFLVEAAGRRADEVLALAMAGRLEGLPAGATLTLATSPAGPALVGAGIALVVAAGAWTVLRGRAWPAMGQAFRAPGDRAPEPLEATTGEPPWEGG
jgi:tryptophan-associated transmembrane protein